MELLEQLIFNGFAEEEFDLLDSKLKIKLRSVSGKQQLEIEKSMTDLKGSANYVVHVFSLKLLSCGLQSYNDEDLTKLNVEQRLDWLKEKPTSVIDMLIQKQQAFEGKCKTALGAEDFENLSETPSTDSASS